MSTPFSFTYGGTVEDNLDPLRLGRLKVRVAQVYGSSADGTNYIGVNNLPWAIPAGMPAGNTLAAGGFSLLPELGDSVFVRFLDGEPEKPVWEWGMQTLNGQKAQALHSYGTGTPVGDPNRAFLTRYGHSLEIAENTVTLTTSEGYQVLLAGSADGSGGSAALQTPAGQSLTLNDLDQSLVLQGLNTALLSAATVILNAASDVLIRATGSYTLMAGNTLLTITGNAITLVTGTGASILVDGDGNIAFVSAGGASVAVENTGVQLSSPGGTGLTLEDEKLSVSAASVTFNAGNVAIGTLAEYPALMVTPSLLAWLIGHTHTNGNYGSPTGPPIPLSPTFPVDSTSTRLLLS